ILLGISIVLSVLCAVNAGLGAVGDGCRDGASVLRTSCLCNLFLREALGSVKKSLDVKVLKVLGVDLIDNALHDLTVSGTTLHVDGVSTVSTDHTSRIGDAILDIASDGAHFDPAALTIAPL